MGSADFNTVRILAFTIVLHKQSKHLWDTHKRDPSLPT